MSRDHCWLVMSGVLPVFSWDLCADERAALSVLALFLARHGTTRPSALPLLCSAHHFVVHLASPRLAAACVPLRAGVLVLSPLTFLAAGALSGLIIWTLSYGLAHPHSSAATHPIPKSTKAIAGSYAALMILLAVISIVGFAGGVRRSPVLVRAYAVVLLLSWFAGLALGGVHIALGFRDKNETIENCRTEQAELWAGNEQMIEIGQGTCQFHFKLVMGLFISIWLVFHLVTLYFVLVAMRAARLLAREKADLALGTYAYPGGGSSLGGGGASGGRSTANRNNSNATLPVIAGGGGRAGSYATGMSVGSSLAEKRDDSSDAASGTRKKSGNGGAGLFGAAITNAASNVAARESAASSSSSSSNLSLAKSQKTLPPPDSSFGANTATPTPRAATSDNAGANAGNSNNSTFLARYASRSSSRDGEGDGAVSGVWGGEAR